MKINQIVHLLITVFSVITIPIQIVSTFVLGLLASLTFGLLLIPINAVWIVVFYLPLIGLSWLYEKTKPVGTIFGFVGIPFAVLGNAFVAIMPSMGEWESRFEKMILCQTFPFSWKYIQLIACKIMINECLELFASLRLVSQGKPLNVYLNKLRADIYSRPEYIRDNLHIKF